MTTRRPGAAAPKPAGRAAAARGDRGAAGATVAGPALASLARFVAGAYGRPGLLAEAGLPEAIAAGAADERYPARALVDLLGAAERATGDPLLALRLATTQDPRRLGVLAYATSNCPTLGEALGSAVRYLGLWNEGLAPTLGPGGGGVALRFEPRGLGVPPDAAGLRQLYLLAATTSVALARAYTGALVAPLSLAFASPPPPAGADEIGRYFGAPPRFGAAATELVFELAALALPVVGADPALYAIVARHADELLARREAPPPDAWAERARAHVVTTMGRGSVELGAVARALGVSERTLQRRLGEEGTSFQEVLDAARYELARAYLPNARLSLSEIAYLLGFQDLSAFYRAFARWAGVTPAEFRRARG
jgi:AraC-like DNA-binding protein